MFGANRQEVRGFVEEAFRSKVVLQTKYDQLVEKVRQLEDAGVEKDAELEEAKIGPFTQIVYKNDPASAELIEKLQHDLAHAEAELAQSLAQTHSIQSQFNDLETMTAKAASLQTDDQEEISELRRTLSIAQQTLLEERQNAQSIQAGKTNAESELASSRRDREELESQLTALTDQVKRLENEAGEAASVQVDDREEVSELSRTLSIAQQTLLEERQNAQLMQSEKSKIESELASSRRDMEALESQLQELTANIQQLETIASHATSVQTGDREEVSELSKRLSVAQQSLLEERQLAQSIKLEKGYVESELASSRRDLEAVETQLQELTAQLRQLETESSEAASAKAAGDESILLTEEIARITQNFDQERQQLIREIENERNSNQTQIQKFDQLEEANQALQSALDSAKKQILELTDEFAANKLGERHDDAESTQRELGLALDQGETLKFEIDKLKRDHSHALQNEMTEAQVQIHARMQSENLARSLAKELEELKASKSEGNHGYSSMQEAQAALDSIRNGAERERQMILEAAQKHADELISRAQRRVVEEGWELRRAQIERQQFLENSKNLLQTYLESLGKDLESGSTNQGQTAAPPPSSVPPFPRAHPPLFSETIEKSPETSNEETGSQNSGFDADETDVTMSANWERRIVYDADSDRPNLSTFENTDHEEPALKEAN